MTRILRKRQAFNFTAEEPEVALKQFFQQRRYVRNPDMERRLRVTSAKYKKGHEVRLVAVQPIFGKKAVEWFLSRETED